MDKDNIQAFIITVRRRALQDERYLEASAGKVGYFAGFVTERLQSKTREMRLAVVQAITGLPLRTFKQLTSSYIDILIEEIKDDTTSVLSTIENECARLLETESDGEPPWNLYPWDKPEIGVSLLQSGN